MPGTFRLGTTKQGFSPKYYASGWRGNQYAKTFNAAKIGRIAGNGLAGVGTLVDGFGVWNYYQNPNSSHIVHPSKAGVNLGVTAYGIWVAPPVALFYFGAEAFYDGGFFQLWNDYGQAVQGVQNEISPTWRLIPFGPK